MKNKIKCREATDRKEKRDEKDPISWMEVFHCNKREDDMEFW